jgi:hypothetical protein
MRATLWVAARAVYLADNLAARGNCCAAGMNTSQLFQFMRQAQTQWAFWSELVEQLFGAIENGRLNVAALKTLTPRPCHLLLG